MSTQSISALIFCLSIYVPRLVQQSAHTTQSSNSEVSSSLLPYVARQATPEGGCIPDQIGFVYENTLSNDTSLARAQAFTQLQNQRRSLRFYDSQPFPLELLMQCIEAGGTAPSGAHQQPWHFSVVRDPAIKAAIREVVELEEQANYDKRMKQAWKDDLVPLFKNSALHKEGRIQKPYLTEAPYVVVVTEVSYGIHMTTGAPCCSVLRAVM